ncbi:MAG: alpha/beta hydrolase [Christensenellaceae bacterium]|nr:alpha/beta hydrolase [Christensenellaceae bacterium]
MHFYIWIIIALAAVILLGYLPMFLITKKIAMREFNDKLVRTSSEKWARENSCPSNAEHSVMYDLGMEWADQNIDRRIPVEVTSCDLKLYGMYFDFGSDSCVIIIPGRAESLNYSYYFAQPYKEAGYNVLVIDTRAHGLSEGKYVGYGIGEIPDVIEWSKLLKDRFGIKKIVIHGICVGSTTAVMASVKEDCPKLAGIVAEGMFKSFYTIFKQRTKNGGHPTFMFMGHIYRMAKKYVGVDIKKQCPAAVMDKMDTPILFFHSLKDDASLPVYAQELYDACASKVKKLVWFDKGAHSHIRIVNKEKYDSEIKNFLKEL